MYPEEFQVKVVEREADVGGALARMLAPKLCRQPMFYDRRRQGVSVFSEHEHMIDIDVGHAMYQIPAE